MSAVALRRALEADAARLSELAFAAKAALGYAPELLQAWRGELTIDAATLRHDAAWLAEDGGAVLGFFCLALDGEAASLTHLWVAPGAQRRGIGSLLLRQALRLAAAAGASRLRVDAEPRAEAFYQRFAPRRLGAVAAPIPGQPQRVRPQLEFSLRVPP